MIISLIYFIFFRIKSSKNILLNLGSSAFIFIFLFYVLWGLNYKRIPIKDHLEISGDFEKNELITFTENLIDSINKKHVFLFKNDSIRPINEYSFKQNLEISPPATQTSIQIIDFQQKSYDCNPQNQSAAPCPEDSTQTLRSVPPQTNCSPNSKIARAKANISVQGLQL